MSYTNSNADIVESLAPEILSVTSCKIPNFFHGLWRVLTRKQLEYFKATDGLGSFVLISITWFSFAIGCDEWNI